jgi:acyl-CoA reductase-like NAD-dependent aldehyde dehydrogenase
MPVSQVAVEFGRSAPLAAAAYKDADRLSGKVLVDGALGPPLTNETFVVENPANMAVVANAPRCREADVERAVKSAHDAYPAWAAIPARERGRMVARMADLIEAECEAVAALLSLETGNALATQARPELAGAIDMLRLFAGLGGELKGRTVPSGPGILHYTTRDPLGVVAGIIPWNAPVYLMAAKMGPALVAGNTMVLKTAEQAPLTVLRCAEIAGQVLPPGVFNVISGFGEEAGRPLAEHPLVRKVTFTGSYAVGREIAGYVAAKLCPVTLELGGKNPNIIMADADLERAIPGVVHGMRFTRQGQSCTAGSRVFVHRAVYDRVVDGVVERLEALRLGDPLDEATEVGAMISEEQFDRCTYYVEMARDTPGARFLCGGGRPDDPDLRKGLFFSPTLIDGIPNDSPVCQEEIFGPVACVLPWTDFDEMMAEANDIAFGLAATLWTRDLNRAMDFAENIQAGFVQVNQYDTPQPNVAYGGLKMSGVGKEYSYESMIDHFTTSKTIIINRGTPG